MFFAEFRFVNAKFLEMIDKILVGSAHEPIILFQADHGSTYGMSVREGRKTNFDAYSAYFAPESLALDVPRPFTFINTFPLILSTMFGDKLELMNNRLIEFNLRDYFDQEDVTETFARWYD